jgi:hypothetical protein
VADVNVNGYWRGVGARKKKRAPAKAPSSYYVAESSTGETCPHHHRTRSGARECANRHARAARMAHARLTRKQARAKRVTKWDVTHKDG